MTFDPLAFPGNNAADWRRVQGWLKLHGFDPGPLDGLPGPKTEKALEQFQRSRQDLCIENSISPMGWKALTAPLARAMAPVQCSCVCGFHRNEHGLGGAKEACRTFKAAATLGDGVLQVARQWLAQSVGGGPLRELAGNDGPVVEACTEWLAKRDRLPCFCGHAKSVHMREAAECVYRQSPGCACSGYAPDWRLPWCAGWVSTVVRQACESLGVEMPIKGSLNCDVLARQAERAGGLWLATKGGLRNTFGPWTQEGTIAEILRPGDLFLVRAENFDPDTPDWTHCGVVLRVLEAIPVMTLDGRKVGGPAIITAEGNTNKDGGREGKELRARIRGFDGLDFICWGRT